MAFKDLLNQTCDIYEDSYTKIKWEQVPTDNIIYQDIPCALYNYNPKLKNREDSQTTDWSNVEMVIEPDKTLVKAGMTVKIKDKDIGVLGTYLIQRPIPQRDKGGRLHHIQMNLSNKVR